MKKVVGIVTALIAVVLVFGSSVFAAPNISDSAFKRVWDRQDLLIDNGQEKTRSWTWGPTVSSALEETLIQGANGKRKVQYFEKSRMEINDPNADANSQWYVTNGLLPIEMMTGKIQTGNDFTKEYEQRGPAKIAVIGDPGNFPTYADLRPLYQSPGNVAATDLNNPVTKILKSDGTTAQFDDFVQDPMTKLIKGENGHGIVQAFDDFMKLQGFVYESGSVVKSNVFNPLFVFGYPITEPYWVMAKVGGNDIPILFQVFERRVLTYNPANPPAFRVEMGNVGSHYYQWRYGSSAITTPTTAATTPTTATATPTTAAYPEPTATP